MVVSILVPTTCVWAPLLGESCTDRTNQLILVRGLFWLWENCWRALLVMVLSVVWPLCSMWADSLWRIFQAAEHSEAGTKSGFNKWICPFRDELFLSPISATVKIGKTRLTEPQWKIRNPVMNQQRIRTADTHLLNNNKLSMCSQEIKTPLLEFDFLWKANPPSGEHGWNGRRSPSDNIPVIA